MNWLRLAIPAAPTVALAAVLAFTSPTYARGGGHGGGFHGGGFHGGGWRGGGWGGGYRGGFYNRGFYGRGYGYRGYGYRRYYPYYGWGGWGLGYYPYYYGNYGTGYYYPSYYSDYSYYPYDSSDYYGAAPADTYQSYYPVAPQAPNAARINVWVPTADAKVWIDGSPTQQTGTYRTFESPALTPGSSYSYTIKGQWVQDGKTVERSQTVHFKAGEQVSVNLAAAE